MDADSFSRNRRRRKERRRRSEEGLKEEPHRERERSKNDISQPRRCIIDHVTTEQRRGRGKVKWCL